MAKDLYSIEFDSDTGEWHIFVSNRDSRSGKCLLKGHSICRKMQYSQTAKNKGLCITEEEARFKCAELGRSVCGICVSDLYRTID